MQKKIDGKIQTVVLNGNIAAVKNMSGQIAPSDGKYIGTTDYEALRNLPSIEGVTLIGDLTFSQLNLERVTNSDLEEILT